MRRFALFDRGPIEGRKADLQAVHFLSEPMEPAGTPGVGRIVDRDYSPWRLSVDKLTKGLDKA
jgi:hypothetical protein